MCCVVSMDEDHVGVACPLKNNSDENTVSGLMECLPCGRLWGMIGRCFPSLFLSSAMQFIRVSGTSSGSTGFECCTFEILGINEEYCHSALILVWSLASISVCKE